MNHAINSPAVPHSPGGDLQPTVKDLARLMRQHLRDIAMVAGIVIALALAYAFLATPIYSADVLIRVDAPDPNAFGVVPQGQVMQPTAPPTDAEIAIMQSRSVIEPVIEQYKFGIDAQGRRFPVLGALAEKFATPGQPARAWFGLDSYAWGGEQIDVNTLTVPPQLEDQKLQLQALDGQHYALSGPDGQRILTGVVGQTAQAQGVTLQVGRLVARPGTRFVVTASNAVNTVKQFQHDLKVSDDGKGTGVVRITFTHRDPVVATGVANAVANSYLATATASHQANDGRTLAFIQQQLPHLRDALAQAETRLAQYRTTSGSMQPAAEAQSYLQGGIDFQRQIALLQLQRTQLSQRFTPQSPELQSVDKQLAQLEGTKHNFDTRFDRMPAAERENADLTRDAKVADSTYVAMLAKAQELSVRQAGTTGDAHIVDAAMRPSRPFKPNRTLVVGAGVVLGVILGMAYVFVRRQLLGGVIDPMFVERYLSVPMFGVVAYSAQQQRLESQSSDEALGRAWQAETVAQASQNPPRAPGAPRIGLARTTAMPLTLPPSAHRLLARSYPQTASIEALRSVRTALGFGMPHAANKVVAIAGPTMGTGKSFVAANLATLLAQAGSRVLLIDADMRCGRLAGFFRQGNGGGLAEVLRGDLQLRGAIRPVGIENLAFIACGDYPSHPSELLMRRTFAQMLATLDTQFDIVLIDTPPFLPVTDSAIITHHAGATLLVLRSGQQTKDELEDTVKGMDRCGARLMGAVFNSAPSQSPTVAAYGYASRHAFEPRSDAARAA